MQEHMRLSELAKSGLIERRQVMSNEVYQMIAEKFEDPMLGILGGHLLLLDKERDTELLRTMVTNLRRLVGRHPDVEALALACKMDKENGDYVFEEPPMLRRSWSIILNSSVANPNLVPSDSLASEIAGHLWGDSPWIIWMGSGEPTLAHSTETRREDRSTRGRSVPALSDAEASIAYHLGLAKSTEEEEMRSSTGPMHIATRKMPKLAMRRPCSEEEMPPSDRQKIKIDDETARKLVYILGIPRGKIEEMADELQEKMG
jgi:hypothetical protein